MKYKYCPKCRKAYVRSRLEGDTCMYCRGQCRTVNVRRTPLYYFGYGLMVLGAASVFVPRATPVSSPTAFVALGLLLAAAGSVTVIWASVGMARTAASMVAEQEKVVQSSGDGTDDVE